MKILDRYVLVEWFKAFLATIAVTLGILILHDMYNNLGDLIEYGSSAEQILEYYGLLIPSLVPVILPISLLISVIFVLGNFHKNNEITAMRASGLHVFRITRALWGVGVLLAGVLFWLNAQLVPYSIEKSRELYNTLEYSSQRAHLREGELVGQISNICFYNKIDRRLWFISKYSQYTNQAQGIEVHIFDEQSEREKILAKNGKYDAQSGTWSFSEGQIVWLDEKGSAIKNEIFKDIKKDEFRENPEIMKLYMSKARDLSLNELRALIEASGGADSEVMRPYAVKLSSIWASPFACIIVIAIAIPFSIAGVRTNPMVGVSKTAGLFFGYYILDSVFSSFGSSGLMNTDLAAWIPNILMLVFALSLYRKGIAN